MFVVFFSVWHSQLKFFIQKKNGEQITPFQVVLKGELKTSIGFYCELFSNI